MDQTICSTCQRSGGDLAPEHGVVKTRDVSLSGFHHSAVGCSLCAFVQKLLAEDPTTPLLGDPEYEYSMIRVDEWGLRFTGQWQGALVVELYKPGELSFNFISRTDKHMREL
jgi:hypothetical protein